MTKPKRLRPGPPVPRDLVLKLDPDAHVRVTVTAPQKVRQPLSIGMHILVAGIAIAAALGLFVYWLFVLPADLFSPIEFKDTSVSVSITYPRYVAFGDEAEMALSVTNHGSEVFTGQITVIFKGNVGARPLPPGRTAIEIKDLVAGASSANRLRFAFARDPGWFSEETIATTLQVSSTAAPAHALPGPEIRVAPVPFLRTSINLITSSAIVVAVAALLWEVVRKRLLGWEAE
ncbi:MAG: hypothetical protein ACREXU_15360 [Gammaproteobacteria bacterium]